MYKTQLVALARTLIAPVLDGSDDLVVGVHLEDFGSIVDAGAIHVLYGSAVGNAATGEQRWSQDSPGISGTPEHGDRFGRALAVKILKNNSFSTRVSSSETPRTGLHRRSEVHSSGKRSGVGKIGAYACQVKQSSGGQNTIDGRHPHFVDLV